MQTINGLQAGDHVRHRQFPEITGVIVSIEDKTRIVVQAPHGLLNEPAQSWAKNRSPRTEA